MINVRPANQTSLTGHKKARARWFCTKPTVNILFYTDAAFINLPDIDAKEFGLRILNDLFLADDSDLAAFQITLINRHDGEHARNRLTAELLNGFDQVWFFGFQLANKLPMEPENELSDAEVAAVTDWMATGGVLMTGDHANPRQSGHDTNLDELLGLGRAIAHRVPRAGALRRWEGGPPQEDEEPLVASPLAIGSFVPESALPQRSHNTQVPTGQAPVDSLDLQEDEWPQQLILTTYVQPSSQPFEQPSLFRRVHPLFCGRVAPITEFPDHMHEGELVIPSVLPPDTWPSGPSGQVLPEVIARGTDKRTGVIHDIVIAYDGSTAGVGRIVADSTWHHYMNVNLKGFPTGGTVISKLAQFYVNLAVWLSPPAKRAAIACWQLWKLLHSPSVAMTYGNSLRLLGSVAADVLRRTAGPCVIPPVFDPVFVRTQIAPDVLLPSDELMLGGVLHAFLETFERADAGEEVEAELDHNALLARGLRSAGDEFVRQLERANARARRGRELLEEQLQRRGARPPY